MAQVRGSKIWVSYHLCFFTKDILQWNRTAKRGPKASVFEPQVQDFFVDRESQGLDEMAIDTPAGVSPESLVFQRNSLCLVVFNDEGHSNGPRLFEEVPLHSVP